MEALKAFLIGIGGGSGAGKTTLALALARRLGAERVVVLRHDDYYRDLSSLPATQRAATDFDRLEALETELLVAHLEALRRGQSVWAPHYDFGSHSRAGARLVEPRPVVIVEGLFVLAAEALRAALDLRLFVDADADVRFIRRLRRDMVERGRTVDSVIEQYLTSVKPAHDSLVQPSARHADVVVRGAIDTAAVEALVARIEAALRRV